MKKQILFCLFIIGFAVVLNAVQVKKTNAMKIKKDLIRGDINRYYNYINKGASNTRQDKELEGLNEAVVVQLDDEDNPFFFTSFKEAFVGDVNWINAINMYACMQCDDAPNGLPVIAVRTSSRDRAMTYETLQKRDEDNYVIRNKVKSFLKAEWNESEYWIKIHQDWEKKYKDKKAE